MNVNYLTLPIAVLLMGNAVAADPSLDSDKKKMSYAIGMQIGKDFSRSGMDIDVPAMSTGISDVLSNTALKLSNAELSQVMNLLREQQMKKQKAMDEEKKALGSQNKALGVAFLEENKKKDGVITLPSGVQYKVLNKGSGMHPTPNNSVVAHYEGRLIDGKVFDSSIKRGEPATFPVTGVIKGWVEVLQIMKVGSKWQVYIPSELAYGARGTGQLIGPNSALIFDIELLEIK